MQCRNPVEKECKFCKNKFTPSKRSDQKYCSEKCCKTFLSRQRHEKHKAVPVKISCQYCGCEAQGRLGKKFCSTECIQEWHKQQKRFANEEKHKLNPIQCKSCNKEFVPYREDQIWCSSDCKMNEYKTSQKEARAAIRAQTARTCPVCDEEFSPKRSMREKYCSPRCRNLFAKKAYKALQTCLKQTDQKKQDRAHKLLGYTPNELREHIQKHPNWNQVKDGDWDLDHIFPIIAFLEHGLKDIGLMCCLENLQPLGRTPNQKKNRKYNPEEFRLWLTNRGVKFTKKASTTI
jgi:hypothetical protein